jgi:hypothetical protein
MPCSRRCAGHATWTTRKFSGLAKVARATRGESPVKAWFADYVDAEGKAHTIRIWQPTIFPGLFQVPEYAMPLFLAMGKGEEWAREQLEVRIGRQAILDRPEPPIIVAVLDQSILYRRIGPPQVMRKQIERVLELAHRPNMMVTSCPPRSEPTPGWAVPSTSQPATARPRYCSPGRWWRTR